MIPNDVDRVKQHLCKSQSSRAVRAISPTTLTGPTEDAFLAKFPLQKEFAKFPDFTLMDLPPISKDEVNKYIQVDC